MNPRYIVNHVLKTIRQNSPMILTGLGVSGVLSTTYLTARASFTAAHVIEREEVRRDSKQPPQWTMNRKEKVQLVWKLYIPAVASGAVTIACIVSGTRIGMKRTAAAYSLLTVSERAFEEYREKVAEQLGERKESQIRDSIAQDRIRNNAPIMVIGSGSVLCCEMHTGRYFMSDMESLRKAVNDINAKLNREMGASLDDFYYIVGLPVTAGSAYHGWDSEKGALELRFTTTLTDDNRPCLAFDYNYLMPF